MSEKQETILRKAAALFMRCGIKSVTMDDVCRELGISKKTLYQFVRDKNDLILQVLNHDICEDEKAIRTIQNSGRPALDELLQIQNMVSGKIKNMHSSIIYDLRKYYPEAWNKMMQYRNEFVVGSIEQNILKGQKEGVFRTDLHAAVIARIYSSRMEVVMDASLFEGLNLNTAEIYSEAMLYHIRGIATDKGLSYLKDIYNTQHA
ncbi:MAG: TetR/AcrR family transcriptional regulator [Bacteroidia bacterium]